MSTTRLAGLAASATQDLAAIIEVVAFDQSLTTALLRSANSSWSAPREPITTVKEAVVRLGTGAVLALALGVNVRARFDRAIPEYGLEEGELWLHSVAASLAAETLGRYTKRPLPQETPTVALLHDVGKLVLSRFLDQVDLHAVEEARTLGVARIQTEREVLGVDHAELGALIAQVWSLPEPIVQGIAHHHDPERADTALAYGVYLSDVVAKAVGGGTDDNADLETFARAIGELGLTADALDEVSRTVSERLAEVCARYS